MPQEMTGFPSLWMCQSNIFSLTFQPEK